jgi:preprotein translocase subunit SecG
MAGSATTRGFLRARDACAEATSPKPMTALFPVLLTIQIVVCVAMIGVILLQRSEGGGLGLGSGGGASGLMTGRGAASALTRTTVILATIFIATSIALALIAKATRSSGPLTPGTDGPMTTLPGVPVLPAQPSPTPQPAPANPSPVPIPATPAPAGGQPAPATPPAQPSGGTP